MRVKGDIMLDRKKLNRVLLTAIVFLLAFIIPSKEINAEGVNDKGIYFQDNGLLGLGGVKDDVGCEAEFSKTTGKTMKTFSDYGEVPVVNITDDSVLKISKKFLGQMKNKDITQKCAIGLTVYPDKTYNSNPPDNCCYDMDSSAFNDNGVCEITMGESIKEIGGDNYKNNLYRFLFYHCDDGLFPSAYFFEFSEGKGTTLNDSEEITSTPKLTKVHWKIDNKCTLYWSYSGKADGYKLEYAPTPEFNRSKTVVSKTKNCTVQGIDIGKTYYIRVRAYKTDDGEKVWSPWSHRIIVNRKR